MSCPCNDCDKKGCGAYHDKCKLYQEFAEERKRINEKKRIDKGRFIYYKERKK